MEEKIYTILDSTGILEYYTKKIEKISETTLQESSAKSFINKFPSAKLIGKNKLGNIIFETNKGRKGITPKGTIL